MKRFLLAFALLVGLVSPASAQHGNKVGSLSTFSAPAGATFTIVTNPGNYFSIVGTEILADPSTPAGQYNVVVQAAGTGFSLKKTFGLNYTSSTPPPVPGVFSVGVDIVGAQNPFPQFPTTASINYFAAKKIKHFRFAIGWSQVNNDPQYNPNNHLVGIQPVAFGPLDTTSTVYNGQSYVGAMNTVISNAMAVGARVLIDIHTFGVMPSTGAVGSVACPFSCFADLWGKIADYYVHVRPDLLPGIYGFDLMNEWQFIDSAIAFNGNQAAIGAARANGYNGPLYVEGVNFSSAWNWVSGQTQSFNNSNLYQLVDPLNNLISSAHMYPDPDDSGSINPQSFAYSVAVSVPGSAPAGLNVNPTIGVTRTAREWQPWLQIHGLRGHMGEFGTSTDNPWLQGAFDYASWNAITRNLLTYMQANNIEINLWASNNGGAGYGPNGYGYSLDPFNSNLSGNLDFTAAGVQEPIWTVIDDFTGYTGAQPTAYALFQPGLATPNPYLTVGTPSAPLTIYYGGRLAAGAVITPHDTLADGTSAGGTFTPATITLAAGDNAVATFTYTASQAATIRVATTNNRGWNDPPTIGLSSVSDPYRNFDFSKLSNEYGTYTRFTPYIGKAVRLQRASDGQQMDWSFTIPNVLGNGLDRQAIQNWASAQCGIQLITLYDQSGRGNDINFGVGGNYPTLCLKNSAGYPEVQVNGPGFGEFLTQVNCSVQFSSLSRMSQAAGSSMGPYRMDWFVGPIVWIANGFTLADPFNLGNQATVTLNTENNVYHDYAVTWVNGASNGFIAYKDAASQSTATLNITATPPTCNGLRPFNNQSQVEFGFFKNPPGSQQWRGVLTSLELLDGLSLTSGQVTAVNSQDNTYYSTPLTDPLSGAPPQIANTLPNLPIFPGFIPARPFGAIAVTDPTGGATETITITLSGAAGTLSGTGVSGTGPYTVGPDTPANVTTTLNQAAFTTAAGVGSTTTFTVGVVSSSGGIASNNSSSTVVSTYSTQAAFTPPGGTFTPVNHSGYSLAGEELNVGLGPAPTQLDYMNSKGFGLMRYVMSSDFLYTSAFGQFSSSYLATMKAVIDYAYTKNIYVVIDPHNSGKIWDATFSQERLILPSMRSQDLFQDFSRRMAAAFISYPNVIYGLVNEPAGMTAVQWRDGGVTPAISAIRATGSTQMIFIPGAGQSSALNWASNGNTAAFAGYTGDPLNNFAFEAHQYLDASASGGGSVATLNGSTILNTFNSFLTTNGFKGFIGEFGMAIDPMVCSCADTLHYVIGGTSIATNSVTANTNMLTAMVSSGLYVGWAAWGGGYEWASIPTTNGYAFNPEPTRVGKVYNLPIVDQQQIAPLLSKVIP